MFSLCLVFAACDSGDDDDGGGGEVGPGGFSTTFDGDIDGSSSGNAFFSVVEEAGFPGERAFVLVMTTSTLTSGNPSPTEWVGIVRPGDRPGEGTYAINDFDGDASDGTFAYYYNFTNANSGEALLATSGTLRITASSADRVVGSFNFEGEVINFSTGQSTGTGSISGSFDAEFVDPNNTPNIPTLQGAAENS